MKDENNARSKSERWAELRFSVVGGLLASPPRRGELRQLLEGLSEQSWLHPITGEPTQYSFSTIERWYYRCLIERGSPVAALRRKVRGDSGKPRVLDDFFKELILQQYQAHPSWSYKLHADNIQAVLEEKGQPCPSYSSILRYMQSRGLFKEKRKRNHLRPGAAVARARIQSKEVRSFEVEYVNGLWHLDFHHCSRQVLSSNGRWYTPICLAVLDDNSRLCCHLQWYWQEDTKSLVHGFSQALQKRGLPRSLLTDNGSAMMSAEFRQGLLRLGIQHETTLPYSPHQNGKQEAMFGSVEGRLIAMIEGYKELSLAQLNVATLAWFEMEDNRSLHEEIGCTPLERYLRGNNVSRPSPSSEELRLAFRRETTRKQRRTDGTISIEGKRFEVPARYHHFKELRVHYAAWDLSCVHLVDKNTGVVLCSLYPLDKQANADGKRRSREQLSDTEQAPATETEVAPLLRKLMAEYAATGLPPAYLPEDE